MHRQSLLSYVVSFFFRISGIKKWRKLSEYFTPPSFITSACIVRRLEFSEKNVWELSPTDHQTGQIILYLHGGGYAKSFQKSHWKFMADLINESGCTIIAPDYPLTPHHTVQDTFSMIFSLYEYLTEKHGAANIILMGDEAGGGLAHAFAQELAERKIEQPAQLILLSPWLDITLSNPLIEDLEDKELILNKQVLRKLGAAYRGSLEATNYKVSPVYGKLRRLPPTTLLVGSEEILLPDCRKLRLKADSEPVVFNYREFDGMFHNWLFYNLPESKRAFRMIIHQIKDQLSEAEKAINAQKHFWKV